jgi:endonuclease-3 related protein
MIDSIDPAALDYLFDTLAATYGPQHWWPHQDTDNPRFEILVGSVLTQHTAWTNVERAVATLLSAGPLTAEALLAYDDLADLIRQAGPHRIKAARLRALCQWFIDCGGFAAIDQMSTDTLCAELRAIRGIGPETADAIALYGCGRPRFVADAYAFRIFERVGWWQGSRRYEGLRQKIEHAAPNRDAAFFDELHALIIEHAKTRCHKQRPDCAHCALAERCARVGVRPAGFEVV